MLALFPATATIRGGELTAGGIGASALADEFGTPLLVYCEQTLRERARLFVRAAPGALVVYGTKAFANVALLRLLAEEGIGADVSTLGELEFARRAGLGGEHVVVHGNNKSDAELRAAAELDALVVLDAVDEVERAAAAGIRRVLVRVTPGVEAETHEAIRTGHRGSKFGLDADDALEAVARARAAVADRLTRTEAYLTVAEESQEIEDELRRLRGIDVTDTVARAEAVETLKSIDARLSRLVVPYEEWEVLYRQRLQVERDLLRVEADLHHEEQEPPDGLMDRVGRAVEALVSR
jgi:diaminopimelate decarboxylase